ncbi:MAG: MarR family winged helix-turn-helix transcriptional regulator [Thermoanaerobaculia bacterium]
MPRPCVCTTVRRSSRVLARAFDAALEPARLGVTQLAVLRAIQRHETEALSRAAEDLRMDRTSFYRALAPMRREGWISMVRGPTARSRSATVTAKGRRVLENADPHWTRTQTAIVEKFGRGAWASLVSELERLSACAEGVAVAVRPAAKGEKPS